MNRTEKSSILPHERNINLMACRLFAGCFVAGASIVAEAWIISRFLPGAHPVIGGVFPVYMFAVGVAAGLALPRRLWVCPIGVSLGFYTTCLLVAGGPSGLGFAVVLMRRAAIWFGVTSFVGALFGAMIGAIGRHLVARRHHNPSGRTL